MEEFLKDPGVSSRVVNGGTVQVRVPKVVPAPHTVSAASILGVGDGGIASGLDEMAEEASAQKKRVALQRQAAVTVEAAEDYARRFESGVNEVRLFFVVSSLIDLILSLCIQIGGIVNFFR